MEWCRGGQELKEVGDLFMNPTLENRGTVMRVMTLPNGWKYQQFTLDESVLLPEGRDSIVNGEKLVPLLSVPLGAHKLALPVVKFLAIDVQVDSADRKASLKKPFHYSVHHYNDKTMDEDDSQLISYAAVEGERHAISYPMMQSIDKHNIPSPVSRLQLTPDDVIAVGLDPSINRFKLTVQVYLTDRDGHMW
jgi:hypothetical protein